MPTLLVLAAGMGSRYGGLKQLDGLGPSGETLLEYALYDARRAGFTRAVFVIRRDIEADFCAKVLARFECCLDCAVVFQEKEDLPGGHEAPAGRRKPWGTAHAVWAAREAIDEPFAVINADDFYGQRSYALLSDFFAAGAAPQEGALVAFALERTLSPHGTVSRALCEVDAGGLLTGLTEHTRIEATGGGIVSHGPQGTVRLPAEAPVSVNLVGLPPAFFALLEDFLDGFLRAGEERRAADPQAKEGEAYLPAAIDAAIGAGALRVHVLQTPESWFGVTYAADRERTRAALQERIKAGEYPPDLWA